MVYDLIWFLGFLKEKVSSEVVKLNLAPLLIQRGVREIKWSKRRHN